MKYLFLFHILKNIFLIMINLKKSPGGKGVGLQPKRSGMTKLVRLARVDARLAMADDF